MAGGLLLLGRAGVTVRMQKGEAGRWPCVMKRERDLELHVHAKVSGKRPKRQAFGETAPSRSGMEAEL